jgi:cold shock CspA family protein
MRFEGTLTIWNADRGYGAIAPLQGGQELFVHISSFPTDGSPPSVDEALSFEIVSGSDGRKQAVKVLRSKRIVPPPHQRLLAPAPRRQHHRRAERSRRLGMAAFGLAMVVGVLGFLHIAHPGGEVLAQKVGNILR